MFVWLSLGELFAVMVCWISAAIVLAKLRAEGYRFSDLFYPHMYARYWQIAPQRGWSRVPVCMLLLPGAYSGLVITLWAAFQTDRPSQFSKALIFLGKSWLFWLFAALCVLSAEGSLVLLKRIHRQLSRILPKGEKAMLDPPWPRSSKELLLGTRLWSYLFELLEHHRKYYPASSLRKAVIIAIVGTFVSIIGLVFSRP
jgi:hypothetical protein